MVWRERRWKPCEEREPATAPATAQTIGGEDGRGGPHGVICNAFRAGGLSLGVEVVMMRQR